MTLAAGAVVVGTVALLVGLARDGDGVKLATSPTTAPPPATAGPPTSTIPPTPSTSPAPSTTSSTRPAPPPTTTAPPPPTTTATTPPHEAGFLREGMRGPDVSDLQQRLEGLGYWVGAVDGVFGQATTHAVVAFQKSAALSRDGVAGPATLAALATASRLTARSDAGRAVEVDLRRQLVLVVLDGQVEWVLDTSTGSEPGTTPTGRFAVYYEVDGYDEGPLGVLYRPKYFIRGVAVHGYPRVPPYPASHGCVRVIDPAMDWLWASGALAMGTPVWVY
jgi:hypothetical protein